MFTTTTPVQGSHGRSSPVKPVGRTGGVSFSVQNLRVPFCFPPRAEIVTWANRRAAVALPKDHGCFNSMERPMRSLSMINPPTPLSLGFSVPSSPLPLLYGAQQNGHVIGTMLNRLPLHEAPSGATGPIGERLPTKDLEQRVAA